MVKRVTAGEGSAGDQSLLWKSCASDQNRRKARMMKDKESTYLIALRIFGNQIVHMKLSKAVISLSASIFCLLLSEIAPSSPP